MVHTHYGAHEIVELHETLSQTIDAIHIGQLYLPHARDPELRQILNNQLAFMTDEYNRLVHMVNGKGRAPAVPYRPQAAGGSVQPLQNAVVAQPNASPQQMDDRDVASGMLAVHKSGAVTRMHAALECADPEIRHSMLQGAANCAHQAYELWGYMSRRGYYPMALLEQMTSDQLLRGYQPASPAGAAAPQAYSQAAGAPDVAAAPEGSVTGAPAGGATITGQAAADSLQSLTSPAASGDGEAASPSAQTGSEKVTGTRPFASDHKPPH